MLRTGELIADRAVRLIAKKALVILVIAIGLPGSLMLMASAANAQEPRTTASMAALKEKTAKLERQRLRERRRLVTNLSPYCISARLR